MSDNRGITKSHILKIVLVMTMVSLSACSQMRPNARILNQVPKGAPVVYQQGWRDGCESGMAIAGNQLYKTVYRNKINPGLVNDTQYYRGWNEAKTYCAHYTMATLWEGGILPKTPTEEKTLFPESPGIFTVMASWGTPTLFRAEEGFGNAEAQEAFVF